MKKLTFFVVTAFIAGIYFSVSAQVCTPHAPGGTSGLTPKWQELDCWDKNGADTSQVIYLQNFDTLGITQLIVDNIYGFPQGIDYVFSNGAKIDTFAAGATGCLKVSGSTQCAPGRYSLYIHAIVSLGTTTLPGEACYLYGLLQPGKPCPFAYFVNVKAPADACDTNATIVSNNTNNFYLNCITSSAQQISISDISVYPNPFSTSAVVSFTSEETGVFDVKLHDLAGKTVYSSQFNVTTGNNRYQIQRNSLPEGVYFLNLSKEGKSITERVTISK